MFQQRYLTFWLVHKLAVNFGANRHLDQVVIDIAYDPRGRSEFNTLARNHVSPDDTVQYDVGHRDAALDCGFLRDTERRLAVSVGVNAAFYDTINMAMAGKSKISGTWKGTFLAGEKIIRTILKYRFFVNE